jgi:hypothetical protein
MHSLAHILSFDVQVCNLALYLAQLVVKAVRLSVGGIGFHHPLGVGLVEKLSVVKLHVVDCLHLTFIEPLDPLTILPKSELYFTILRN